MSENSLSARTYLSVLDDLRKLEQERDWLRFQVGGWSVWPLFRFSVTKKLSGITSPRSPLLSRRKKLRSYMRDTLTLVQPRRFRMLVKTYSTARGKWTENGYKDIYFDDLLLRIGSYFKIEHVNNTQYLERSRQAVVPSNMMDDIFHLPISVARRVRLPAPDVQEVATQLDKEFTTCFGSGFMPIEQILIWLQHYYWLKLVYKQALRWWRPEIVLVHNPSEFSLVSAAHELGIPIVEFQHGVLDGAQHPSYSWASYARSYRDKMPVSDFFFVYGDYWSESLKLTGFWGDEVLPVGSLNIDSYRRAPLGSLGNDRPHVVYTSTGVEQYQVARFLVEALSQWPSATKPRLTIKLHPGYDPDPRPFLDATADYPEAKVLLGNQRPLTYELMRHSHLHCSINSTCHFESLALGTPTVILPFTGHEYVMGLVNRSHARLVTTPEEFRHALQDSLHERVPDTVGSYYFKPNALVNMVQAIESQVRKVSHSN